MKTSGRSRSTRVIAAPRPEPDVREGPVGGEQRRHDTRRIPLLLVVLLAAPAPALAWGDVAHRVICELAFRELDDVARAEVKRLTALHPDHRLFSASCNWPDHESSRREDHYVNVPRDWSSIEEVGCPLAGSCLLTAARDDLALLADREAGDRARADALAYVGHWIGDLHQPLHVSFEDDRGGNRIEVSGPVCERNLHAAWDGCLVEASLGADIRRIAGALGSSITDDERRAWTAGGLATWATESLVLARSPAVGYCVLAGGRCDYARGNPTWDPGEPERVVEVTAAYAAGHRDTVELRLKQAGVRLAHLLDRVLGRSPAQD